jgi:hypothetical protein
MSFTPALPGTNFYRNWPVGGSPGNGTIFLFAGRPWQSLRFGFTNGTVFQMVSVDLGDFFALPNNVRFVGYMQGGGTVTTNFITGGNGNFQTFFFGQEFSNLDHVDMPNITFYLDNVTFKIPEPSVGGIFVLAALILGVRRLCIR